MLDANIKAQLQSYFTKLRRPIVLKAALDGSQDATNIEALLKEVAELSDKISYEVESDASVRRPSFTVAPQGGHEGIRFACLPMGHEFTSFVLALLQTAIPPRSPTRSPARSQPSRARSTSRSSSRSPATTALKSCRRLTSSRSSTRTPPSP